MWSSTFQLSAYNTRLRLALKMSQCAQVGLAKARSTQNDPPCHPHSCVTTLLFPQPCAGCTYVGTVKHRVSHTFACLSTLSLLHSFSHPSITHISPPPPPIHTHPATLHAPYTPPPPLGRRVSLVPSEGAYGRHVKGSSSPHDLEATFQLLHLLFTQHPQLQPGELDSVMVQVGRGWLWG